MDTLAGTTVRQRMQANLPQMLVSKKADKSQFLSNVLDSFQPQSVQVDENDPRVAIKPEERAVYLARNGKQAEKNPAIANVIRDPRAFFKDLEGRFEAQKALTPEDPYSFEIGDYGVPVLKDIDRAIDDEIQTLSMKKDPVLKDESGMAGLLSGSSVFGLLAGVHLFDFGRTEELDTGLKYLRELKSDIGKHIEDDSISYRRLNELGYFSARALGHFDREDLSFFDRNFLRIDRHLLGYSKATISEEYERYKNNDFKLFRESAGEKGIEMVSEGYEQGMFHPEHFELASLPVATSLGPGVFMQLMPHDVFLMGVTPEPEAADGFNRPGGDFYLHDARHASSIYVKRKIYEKTHNLSVAQIAKLETLQSKWKQEMVEEKKKLDDKELRYAIGFLSFNHHHDRGIPQLPSSFLAEDHGGVANKLYLALKLSGQPIGFDNPRETLDKAYSWLQDFWLERLPQEEEVLSASAHRDSGRVTTKHAP